jgi:hypothetical protein
MCDYIHKYIVTFIVVLQFGCNGKEMSQNSRDFVAKYDKVMKLYRDGNINKDKLKKIIENDKSILHIRFEDSYIVLSRKTDFTEPSEDYLFHDNQLDIKAVEIDYKSRLYELEYDFIDKNWTRLIYHH